MSGSQRSSAGLDERRRRILFRSWHRGTREMDLIMGRFADAKLDTLSEPQLDQYEVLIELLDGDLFAWLTGAVPIPPEHDSEVWRLLRDFHTHMKPLHV